MVSADTVTLGREVALIKALFAAPVAGVAVGAETIAYPLYWLHNSSDDEDVAMTDEEKREQRRRYYEARTPEQKARYRAKSDEWHARKREAHIAERAAQGLALGQRHSSPTEDEVAERKAAKAARRRAKRAENIEAAREVERIKARKAAARKAEAEGRVVEQDLNRPKAALLTEDEKRERRRIKSASWREANKERAREIGREAMKRAAAEKAIAEGREPGKIGRPAIYTEEELRAKRRAKNARNAAANIDKVREVSRIREAQKRAGTFVSRGLPKLTEEQRKAAAVAMSANRRARLRANGGRFTKEDVAALRVAQRERCLFCGDPFNGEPLHVDHWIPIVRGGPNGPGNIALLHQSCNTRKGARLPSDFGLPDDVSMMLAALNEDAGMAFDGE